MRKQIDNDMKEELGFYNIYIIDSKEEARIVLIRG